MGFHELRSAPCVFLRNDPKNGGVTFILVYVHDLLVFSSSQIGVGIFKRSFENLNEIRIADAIDLFLGVKLNWKLDLDKKLKSVSLSQTLYIQSVFRRLNMETCNPVPTPMLESFWRDFFKENDKTVINEKLYEQMIGSLLYLALRMRMDVLTPVLI